MSNPIADLAQDPDGVAQKLGPTAAVAGAIGESIQTAGSNDELRPGSVTKVITATAVMQCIDDGLFGLDDSVTRWAPKLPPAVTVVHLLSHSSGLDAGDVFVDTGDDDDCLACYVELLDGVDQLFPPGHTFSYNNAGIVLAGHIAALARDMNYEDVVRTHIFERAGMTNARFAPEHNGSPICSRALAPAGGTLACTAEDLARFAVSRALVKPDTAALMRKRRVTAPGGVAQMTGVGLGWQIWRNELGETVRHGGAYPNHSAIIVLDPATDATIVMMMPTQVAIEAMNALLDAGGPVVATDGQPGSLELYAGEFKSHAMRMVLECDGDRVLQMSVNGAPGFPLEVVDRSTFAILGSPFAIFDFDERGAPQLIRWRMRVQARVS
jgi:hypothetical protein